jgi:hypothetical protein
MNVVERQHHWFLIAVKRLEEPRDGHLERAGFGPVQRPVDVLAHRRELGHRAGNRRGEQHGIVVTIAEGDGGEGSRIGASPFREDRGLTESGGGVDHDD